MKHYCLAFVCLMLSFSSFADNVKEILEKVPFAQLPFACTKTAVFIRPKVTYPGRINTCFPLNTYDDLGLTQKYDDPNVICCDVFRKFQLKSGKYELVALDVNIFERTKKVLVVYQNGELVDYIEAEVCWYPDSVLFVKQWRITSDEEIIVTWLKVLSETPINAFSNFKEVTAQRIDMHYRIDANGKFQLTKEVKYTPRNYTRTYLADKTKNLWEGNETPIME